MNKKVLKNILKVFMIIVGIIVILFIAFIIYLGFSKTDISNVEWSYSIDITMPSVKEDVSEILQEVADENQEDTQDFYVRLNWYDSVEEAILDDSKFESSRYKDYVLDREILRLKFEDRMVIFFTMPNGANEKQELLTFMLFAIKDDQISQPYEYQVYAPEPGMGDKMYYYDCDDAIADYIIFELRINRVLDEHQLQMFFGSWKNREELESLSISGVSLEIMEEPLRLNGKEYYFWYLTDLSWCEKLQDIHWSKFTYADVIELLDIQYTPTETK